MRRVIDDEHFEEIANKICAIIKDIPADEVSESGWCLDKDASVYLIANYIKDRLEDVKFGKNEHAHGIGNNNAIELIYTGNPKEEQICGYLHLVNNMYGCVVCYVTDIEGNRLDFPKREIHGCNKNNDFSMQNFRFSGWEDKYGWQKRYEKSLEQPSVKKTKHKSDIERD